MAQRRRSLADYPKAPLCGPDAAVADRCADARVRPAPSWRTTDFPCDGAREVDGVMTVCSHGCHDLPDLPSESARRGAL